MEAPPVLWLTGFSGSGKTTLAAAAASALVDHGHRVYRLDGDRLRAGINADLGMSMPDRNENVRRAAEIAKLFHAEGYLVICSFISPTAEMRAMARDIIGRSHYVEIHVATSLEECERRDRKGLYASARAGRITGMTGVDSPYEPPTAPAIRIDAGSLSPGEGAARILALVASRERRVQ